MTVASLALPSIRPLPLPVRARWMALVALQIALVAISNRLAFALRFDGEEPAWVIDAIVQTLPWLLVIRGLTFLPFGLYRRMWRYTGAKDLQALVLAIAASSLLFAAVVFSPIGPEAYPRSVVIIDALLLISALGSLRVVRRLYASGPRTSAETTRLLIIGAGDAGELITQDMLSRAEYRSRPAGFIDDDPSKVGQYIHGVPVLGTRADLADIVSGGGFDEVLIAIPSASDALVRAVVRALEPFDLPIKTLPRLRDIVDGVVNVNQIRTLALDDLLARAPVGVDRAPLHRFIAGRRVLVTGAGGSIGGELCQQLAEMRPASLVMLDRYENGLHAVHMKVRDAHGAAPLHAVIADITDVTSVEGVFGRFAPEIVFHAAAHKHVPLMETTPCEAIKNNVTGTRLLAEAAERHGVERFILISTDKAVNPSSVMGASKRLAELVIRARAAASTTSFAAVRFGNVLGSNGSVIPTFLEQIRRGGPVTVTHPDVKRFFMLTSEAVQLVLHAAAQATHNATYVLEMGDQVRVLDMARHLIRLSGLVPDRDIAIEFTGLRPGEKLYEELVGDGEAVAPSPIDKIQQLTENTPPSDVTMLQIEAIEAHAAANDAHGVLALLDELFPTRAGLSAQAPAAESVRAVRHLPAGDAAPACVVCRVGRMRRWRPRAASQPAAAASARGGLFACDECGWLGWQAPAALAGSRALAGASDLKGSAGTPVPFVPYRGSSPRSPN